MWFCCGTICVLVPACWFRNLSSCFPVAEHQVSVEPLHRSTCRSALTRTSACQHLKLCFYMVHLLLLHRSAVSVFVLENKIIYLQPSTATPPFSGPFGPRTRILDGDRNVAAAETGTEATPIKVPQLIRNQISPFCTGGVVVPLTFFFGRVY